MLIALDVIECSRSACADAVRVTEHQYVLKARVELHVNLHSVPAEYCQLKIRKERKKHLRRAGLTV